MSFVKLGTLNRAAVTAKLMRMRNAADKAALKAIHEGAAYGRRRDGGVADMGPEIRLGAAKYTLRNVEMAAKVMGLRLRDGEPTEPVRVDFKELQDELDGTVAQLVAMAVNRELDRLAEILTHPPVMPDGDPGIQPFEDDVRSVAVGALAMVQPTDLRLKSADHYMSMAIADGPPTTVDLDDTPAAP